MVGVARLKLATPASQMRCAIDCATPRYHYFVVIVVVNNKKLCKRNWNVSLTYRLGKLKLLLNNSQLLVRFNLSVTC